MHQMLDEFRVNTGREFFKVDPVLIERAVLNFIAEQDQVVGKNSSYLEQSSQLSNGQQKNLMTPFEIQLQDFKMRRKEKINAEENQLSLKERDLRARLELERLWAEEKEKEKERSLRLEIAAEYLKLLEMSRKYQDRTGHWSGSYYSRALHDVQSKIDILLSQYPWLKDAYS